MCYHALLRRFISNLYVSIFCAGTSTLFLFACQTPGTLSLPNLDHNATVNRNDAVFYGESLPTLYSLSTSQQNAVVAVCLKGSNFCFCTATLISPHIVLTADHCLDTLEVSDIEIRIGSDNNYPVETLSVYEMDDSYDWQFDYRDDVAIIILSETSTHIKPIPIKSGGLTSISREYAQAAGYGRTQADYYNTDKYWTSLYVEYVYDDIIGVNGFGQSGVSHGDSGGPLLFDFGQGAQMAGVTSTAREGWVYEANYVSVTRHEDWIKYYVNQYDTPDCSGNCIGAQCGNVGDCICGACEYGFECKNYQCEAIESGYNGVCLAGLMKNECSTSNDCNPGEICTSNLPLDKECAEICGPKPCSFADMNSYCYPIRYTNGGYKPICIEANPPTCTTLYESCQSTGDRMGLCLEWDNLNGKACLQSCEPIVTCPLGEACMPYSQNCDVMCANVECGTIESCDCDNSCDDHETCLDNICVCQPDCVALNKKCGDNGCGGSCGECGTALVCLEDFRCGACACDVDQYCNQSCKCDPDCPCLCNINQYCEANCSCDPDCPCTCDSDATCTSSCSCDSDCPCNCNVDNECTSSCTCDSDCTKEESGPSKQDKNKSEHNDEDDTTLLGCTQNQNRFPIALLLLLGVILFRRRSYCRVKLEV